MSAKPFQRKDLKHDEFIIGAGRAVHWLMDRRRRIGWLVLGLAVVVSIVFSLRFAHQRQEQQAAALLAGAMEVYRAPVVAPEAEPAEAPATDGGEDADAASGDDAADNDDGAANSDSGDDPSGDDSSGEDPSGDDPSGDDSSGDDPSGDDSSGDDPPGEDSSGDDPAGDEQVDGTDAGDGEAAPDEGSSAAPEDEFTGLQYATSEEKFSAAIERFEPIVERYGGRPSGRLAAFYLGISHAELGNADAATAAFMGAAEASEPLIAAMALFRLGQLELGGGDAAAALEYFEQLVDDHSGVFPQEQALMAKARAQHGTGDARAALGTYQRVLNDFPGTSAEAEARTRVEELSAQLGVDARESGSPSD